MRAANDQQARERVTTLSMRRAEVPSWSMTRDDILAMVRANEARLRKFGVQELALFGSFARGDASDDSDIDFLVEFDHVTFDNYLGTKWLLERLFGRQVDLGREINIKPRLRERILNEAVRAM
jgi:predicted nucleotidyltransferase